MRLFITLNLYYKLTIMKKKKKNYRYRTLLLLALLNNNFIDIRSCARKIKC